MPEPKSSDTQIEAGASGTGEWGSLTLAQALEQISDAFALLDPSWRILYANAEAHRIARRAPGELQGKILWDEWPGGRESEVGRQYLTAVREQRSVHFEFELVQPERTLWLDIHAHPLSNGGLAAYYRDVTDRKNVEQEHQRLESALARKAEEFETLFNHAPVGIAVSLDPNCEVIRVNPEFERMLGMFNTGNVSKSGPGADQLPFRFLRNGQEVPGSELPQQVAQRTGQPVKDQELEVVSADGTRYSLYGSAVPLFDAQGAVRGSIAAWIDFTARRRQEEEAQRLTQRLRFHVENTPLAVIQFDPDFRIVNWSARAEELFGWVASEVVGKRISDIRFVHEQDLAAVVHLSSEMAQGRNIQNVHRNRNYRKDGSIVWCEWYNSALIDPNGQLLSVFSLVLDVTDRIHHEAALQQSSDDWERFSGILAHDLREPLRNIKIFAEKLGIDYGSTLDSTGRTLLQQVAHGADTMADLLQNLLQFIRAAQTGNLHLAPTQSKLAAASAVRNLFTAIEETSATVHMGDLPEVLADESQLTVVFQNLIANSIRYRKPTEPPVIHISAVPDGDRWIFSVSDNGIGFDMTHAARIFQPFERLHSKKVSGSGLGLAIVTRIVERLGGSVWAESTPGVGSTFFFSVSPTPRPH